MSFPFNENIKKIESPKVKNKVKFFAILMLIAISLIALSYILNQYVQSNMEKFVTNVEKALQRKMSQQRTFK